MGVNGGLIFEEVVPNSFNGPNSSWTSASLTISIFIICKFKFQAESWVALGLSFLELEPSRAQETSLSGKN